MTVIEYGEHNPDVVIFLHGGGLFWWNFREEAIRLERRYHVVVPVLDGHAGSDRPFISIEHSARELISYIDARFGGSVLTIGGLSLGGQILAEMLSQRADICRYAVIESASVIPTRTVYKMIRPLMGMSYKLIKKQWFSELQFRSLHMDRMFYEEYYKDTCEINRDDMIAFLRENAAYAMKAELTETKADVAVLVGGKEPKRMIRSARMLHAAIPNSTLRILDGYYHGDISINHPEEYISVLDRQIQ